MQGIDMKGMETYTVSRSIRIDSADGFYFEIRPDTDGLGCVEVVYKEDNQKEIQSLCVDTELARKIANSIHEIADHVEQASKD